MKTFASISLALLSIVAAVGCQSDNEDRRWEPLWGRSTTSRPAPTLRLTDSQLSVLAADVKDRYDNMFDDCREKATALGRDRCLNDKINSTCGMEFGFYKDETEPCEQQVARYIRNKGGHSWLSY